MGVGGIGADGGNEEGGRRDLLHTANGPFQKRIFHLQGAEGIEQAGDLFALARQVGFDGGALLSAFGHFPLQGHGGPGDRLKVGRRFRLADERLNFFIFPSRLELENPKANQPCPTGRHKGEPRDKEGDQTSYLAPGPTAFGFEKFPEGRQDRQIVLIQSGITRPD